MALRARFSPGLPLSNDLLKDVKVSYMRHYNNVKVKKTISYFPVKLQDCQEAASGNTINLI